MGWRVCIGAVLAGLAFFGVLMGAALGLVTLNAATMPGVPWFPVPAATLLAGALWGAERFRGIGLSSRPSGLRVWVAGVGVTLFGVAACAVQGKFTGFVRATELPDTDVSRAFEFAYAIFMAVYAAVLAEATFRGIVQTRMQTVLGTGSVVVLVGLLNVFAHRWGPEITQNGVGLFAVLAGWTWLRAFADSLWPPLVLHAGVNLVVALGLWFLGPLEHAAVPGPVVAWIGVLGVLGLAAAVSAARPRRSAGRG